MEYDPDIERLRRQRGRLAGLGAETDAGFGGVAGMGAPPNPVTGLQNWLGNLDQQAQPGDVEANRDLRTLATQNATDRGGAMEGMQMHESMQGAPLPGEREQRLGVLARMLQEMGIA